MNQTPAIISADPIEPDQDEVEESGSSAELRRAAVSAGHHGERIDRAIVDVAPEFSRSYLQQLIEAGLVKLNGKTVIKSSGKVKAGDFIEIELRPTPQSQSFRPESIPLDIVFEDEHLLVINKPAGMVVHPAPGNWSGTLLNALLGSYPDSVLVPRAGIVHRLDKDTSGLMVVAKTRLVMDALVQAIAAREVSRQYLAIGHKPWVDSANVHVNQPIGRDPKNRLRMAVVDLEKVPGKQASTDVTLLGGVPAASFVQCKLHTGRTHQIRVHMAFLGHPLIADTTYGGTPLGNMGRQALHAYRLAFAHPITGAKILTKCDPPKDFQGLLEALGLSYNPTTMP